MKKNSREVLMENFKEVMFAAAPTISAHELVKFIDFGEDGYFVESNGGVIYEVRAVVRRTLEFDLDRAVKGTAYVEPEKTTDVLKRDLGHLVLREMMAMSGKPHPFSSFRVVNIGVYDFTLSDGTQEVVIKVIRKRSRIAS